MRKADDDKSKVRQSGGAQGCAMRPISDKCPCEAGAQLRAILDNALEGIVVIDEHGNIETFNRAAAAMFGYGCEEVLGRNVKMLMPGPFAREHDQYLQNYLKTREATIIGVGREAVGLRKDGGVFPIELSVSEVLVKGKRSFTGLVRDITERKRLEGEMLDVSEREQRRIGHDLHDGVCQELAGIAFLVQAMEQKLGSGGTISVEEATTARKLIQDSVRHARGLSQSLYPVNAQPNGLAVGLQKLAINTADLFQVSCSFQSDTEVELADSRAATHFYRIAQEAVRDAIHHGKATELSIRLSAEPGIVRMCVADNGLKLSEDGRYREEIVLRMIQHRAAVIGAKLVVQPRSPSGVMLICDVTTPVDAIA